MNNLTNLLRSSKFKPDYIKRSKMVGLSRTKLSVWQFGIWAMENMNSTNVFSPLKIGES